MSAGLEVKKIKVPGQIYSGYMVRKPAKAKRLFLLLHGYSEAGDYFFRKLRDSLPEDAAVVSPHGPFFLPVRARMGYRAGYSWYFYDFQSDEYIVDMKIAIQYVRDILKKEGLSNLPLTIIGFSQGGYLAPFVGLSLKTTEEVIGINCEFLDEEFPKIPKFKMISVNGDKDDVVSATKSESAVRRLSAHGADAHFKLVKDGTHRVDDKFLNFVKGHVK